MGKRANMPRYVAFLRGVSPVNAKNIELKRAFEQASFTDLKTVFSSGNVAFNAPAQSAPELARQAEAAIEKHLGRSFYTVVRPHSYLRELVEADPFAGLDLPANAKRIVTFLGEPYTANAGLPLETGDGWLLAMYGGDVFSAYIPNPRGSKVMVIIEKMFGRHVTTRTWETVMKCAIA